MKSVFKDKIISQKAETDIDSPTHSPDLNVLDYWFWAGLHKLISHHEPKTKQQLKSFCNMSCILIEKESVAKVIDDFSVRLKAVIYNNGGHFEDELQKLKRRWSKSPPEPCSQCKLVHRCLYLECEKCLETFQSTVPSLGIQGFNEIHDYLSSELDVDAFEMPDASELDYDYRQ